MAVTEEHRHDIIMQYTHGDCGVLAIALHQKTHLKLIGVSLITGRTAWQHFAVQDAYEPEFYWDIRGKLDQAGLYKGFFGTLQLVTDVTVEEIAKFYREYGDLTKQKRDSLAHFLELHPELPSPDTREERRTRRRQRRLVGSVGIEPTTSPV